jgi:hypothetical protein
MVSFSALFVAKLMATLASVGSGTWAVFHTHALSGRSSGQLVWIQLE